MTTRRVPVDYDVLAGKRPCPREADHTQRAPEDAAASLASWHTRQWARGLRPAQCAGCGLFVIWEARP